MYDAVKEKWNLIQNPRSWSTKEIRNCGLFFFLFFYPPWECKIPRFTKNKKVSFFWRRLTWSEKWMTRIQELTSKEVNMAIFLMPICSVSKIKKISFFSLTLNQPEIHDMTYGCLQGFYIFHPSRIYDKMEVIFMKLT